MFRICFIGLTLLACVQAQAADKYALLIGVSKYDHAEMNKPEPLKFPEEDAKALGELLKKGGYEVDLLLGKDAIRERIRTKLSQVSQKGSSDGVVLIGLFGHGVEIETHDENKQIVLVGCFCPFDTEIQVAKDDKGRIVSGLIEPNPTSLVKLSDLMVTLSVAKAGHRVVLADCCRTVPNHARGRSFGAGFRAQDLPDDTSVLFGCSPNEKAFEHPDWGHGAFTKCLLESMKEMSANGKVRTAGLADLLIERVPELVQRVAPRDHQTPKLFSTNSVDLQLSSLSGSTPSSTTAKPSATKDTTQPQASGGRGFEGSKAGDRKELVPGMPFRWCPAGTNENIFFPVSLTSGFWLSETEVTQGQWQSLMQTTPWTGKMNVKEGGEYAASYISHDDAVKFCEKMTSQERKEGRLSKGWKFSLPTEAQWEYACRSGTKTNFSFGDSEHDLIDYGWFNVNAGNLGEKHAHLVGQKNANAWGFKDMHGNVWEWCSDWYQDSVPKGRDPQGPSSGSYRVRRGGSWNFNAMDCSSWSRSLESPGNRRYYVGFRVAAVPE